MIEKFLNLFLAIVIAMALGIAMVDMLGAALGRGGLFINLTRRESSAPAPAQHKAHAWVPVSNQVL